MRNVVEKKWCELSVLWDEFYDNNVYATPFQSYAFLTVTGKGKPQRKDLLRLLSLKEMNLVLYVNDEITAIAPLLIKRKHKKHIVYFRGQFTTANHLDFLYKPGWSYEDCKFLMDSIRSSLGDVSFMLERVSEKSVTSQYLKEYFAAGRIEKQVCVSVPVPQNYDDWHKSLNKSVRRNMVTHKNRLERDLIDWSTVFYCGDIIGDAISKKMMLVYADRFLVKNHFHFGPLKKLIKRILLIILLRDKVTQYLNNSKNNFHAIVYMNREIAAFTSGLICNDKRVILSRLAISTKYAKYGPGGILLSAVMQYVIEQNEKGQVEIDELDLSAGGQGGMSYKYAYGGKEHLNFAFMD